MLSTSLDEVDPLRHAEVRRRIGVIEDYLTLGFPTAAQTAAHAARLGMSTAQFYRLVRSWRLHRNPAVLAGSGARGRSRHRPDGVSLEARSIVDAVIAELGAGASQTAIYREAVKCFSQVGSAAPSRGAVWTYVMAARSDPRRLGLGPARIVVGRCHAALPTSVGSKIVFPELALALLLPDRRIVGIDVACGPRSNASAGQALAAAFSTLDAEFEGGAVVLDAGDAADARDAHLAKLDRPPVISRVSTSQELSRALGRTIGGLRILYRSHVARPAKLLATPKNTPLDVAAAKRQIALAVERHNLTLETVSSHQRAAA